MLSLRQYQLISSLKRGKKWYRMTKDCTVGNYRSKQHFTSCGQPCLGNREDSSVQAKGGETGKGDLLQVTLCRSHQKLICIPLLQYATGNLVNYLFCMVLIVSDLGRCQSQREVIYFKHTQWFPAQFLSTEAFMWAAFLSRQFICKTFSPII